MINRTIGHGEMPSRPGLPRLTSETTNEMLDEFAFLSEDLAKKLVITNPNHLAWRPEPVEVVKGDLYSLSLTRPRRQSLSRPIESF